MIEWVETKKQNPPKGKWVLGYYENIHPGRRAVMTQMARDGVWNILTHAQSLIQSSQGPKYWAKVNEPERGKITVMIDNQFFEI